jgi:hypothetical protein
MMLESEKIRPGSAGKAYKAEPVRATVRPQGKIKNRITYAYGKRCDRKDLPACKDCTSLDPLRKLHKAS